MDLRKAFNTTATVIDLASGVYELEGTIKVTGRRITGNGAVIRHLPSSLREQSAFILKGQNPRIDGRVTVVGSAPPGAPYDPSREAQHAVQVDGAVAPNLSGWTFRNVYGDGIYFGKVDHLAAGAWTRGATVEGITFDEIGRHAITGDALDVAYVTALNVGRCNLAIFDVEPPGHSWGCKKLTWNNSQIFDTGGGFVFANKGVGSSVSVQDITLDNIHCHHRLFNVQVNPPDGVRRQNFKITNCSGKGVAYVSPLTFRHVDGVTVSNVVQSVGPGIDLVTAIDCT